MIGSDLDRLDLFAKFGVRIVQLTYNGRELLGDGCLERANAGLSRLGVQAVERLNALRTLIDLSHCGQRTTAEAIVHSKAPVAITHSGCHALADRPRNKRDDELRLMADRGGVLGIYLMPFLVMGAQPTADDVLRHIEHAVRVCGEDHVGIGSDGSITPLEVTDQYRLTWHDFVAERIRLGIAAPGEDPNVFPFVPDFNSPRKLEQIAQRLSAAGHRSARIEKIIGGNWMRLLSEVWGEGASAASTGASRQEVGA
jgi:membrane dipeptidase